MTGLKAARLNQQVVVAGGQDDHWPRPITRDEVLCGTRLLIISCIAGASVQWRDRNVDGTWET